MGYLKRHENRTFNISKLITIEGNLITKVAFKCIEIGQTLRGDLITKLLVLIFVASAVGYQAQAVIINAVSCSQADVQSAVTAAVAGDTVTIPAGNCAWTGSVVWSAPANVTLKGAGTSVTGGGDQTVITDNYTANNPLLNVSVSNTGTFRMTGITFKGGSGALKDNGMLKLNGPGTVRLDHLHINMQTYNPAVSMKLLWVGNGVRGVLDHSILDLYGLSWIHIVNGTNNGDTEWAAATGFGSSDFFYIEDNIVNGDTSGTIYISALTDCHSGGKFVVRFNSLAVTGISQTHPTGHSQGDDRGCRAHENYGNLVTSPLLKDPNFALDYNNSGGAIVWGNSANNVFKNMIYFNICRTAAGDCGYTQLPSPNGWGYCNGSSAWDKNSDATGYACIDQPGRGQGDLLVGSYATSNRKNNATGTVSWPNQALEPIYEWNNMGNVVPGWGGNWLANLVSTRIVQNRDFYLHHGNTSCNPGTAACSAGTGMGPLAQRPANCTVGVAYFATDQGSWNTSTSNPYGVQQNGADGVLYKCTATNTWSLYYTPYMYPHPLVTGTPSPPTTIPPPQPAKPKNLKILSVN